MIFILRLLVCVALVCSCGCSSRPVAQPVYGTTNPAPAAQQKADVQYYGSAIELRPEMEQLYRELHAEVWPEVLAAIEAANIRNYNIFVAELGGKRYLFSFFEYHGSDAEADFASIAKDPTTSGKWWPVTDACQRRLPGTPDGLQWMALEMLMHIN